MGRYLDLAEAVLRGRGEVFSYFPRRFPRTSPSEEKSTDTSACGSIREVSSFNSYNCAHEEEKRSGDTKAPLRENEKNEETQPPVFLRDGRRLWRWRATAIPANAPEASQTAADEARWLGGVLVADGADLILVEPWLSRLSDETRNRLAADPGGAIAYLRQGRGA